MTGARPADILRQLEEPASTDCDLLKRFLRERDQMAFRELVIRHGPFVLGVCRRVTCHRQDAEDAFQAVFLILARKARSIKKPEVLGSWLHKVALRVALTARRSVFRRRSREAATGIMYEQPAPSAEPLSELSAILDEELDALPSWYRDAIVLCDLRGVSREEAAGVLGVPEGTLSSRLANGRKKLAARLTKRGIALSVAALSDVIPKAQATVSSELVGKTCGLVAEWMASGAIPRPIIELTGGGTTVRKVFLLGMFATAIAVVGVVYAAQPVLDPPTADPPKSAPIAGKFEEVKETAPDGKPGDKPIAFTNTPKLRHTIDIDLLGDLTVFWNAQGTHLAIGANKGKVFVVQNVSVDTSFKNQLAYPYYSQLAGFTADGKHYLVELREYRLVSGLHQLRASGDLTRPEQQRGMESTIELDPKETEGYAFSADGKTFRTVAIYRDPKERWKINKLQVLEVDAVSGKQIKSLLTTDSGAYTLSTDGKRLAVLGQDDKVVVYDVDRAAKLSSYQLAGSEKNAPKYAEFSNHLNVKYTSPSLTFSPDGHRLIVCRGIGNTQDYGDGSKGADMIFVIKGGIGQTVVLNADTGEPLPPLEGGECLDTNAGSHSFSANGRLLALCGDRFEIGKQKLGEKEQPEHLRTQILAKSRNRFLTVWDTQTGKILKTWDTWDQSPQLAFNPVRPILAIFESRGDDRTRLGLWDFSAEFTEKK
ncbi:MAG TPA: RNA polymerase sigma factor [Gemmata sp.]|nr:RNA polymerase sigma factor [Gemmata sp.]